MDFRKQFSSAPKTNRKIGRRRALHIRVAREETAGVIPARACLMALCVTSRALSIGSPFDFAWKYQCIRQKYLQASTLRVPVSIVSVRRNEILSTAWVCRTCGASIHYVKVSVNMV